MDDNSSAQLAFRSLSYEGGIEEINAFYPSHGSPESESDNAARLGAIGLDSGRTEAIGEQGVALSEDNDYMEDVEHSHYFTPPTEPARQSTSEIEHTLPASNPYNKATPPHTSDEAGPGQIVDHQKLPLSTFTMEDLIREDGAAALSGSPVPPLSSNRGELQAEMRHEEEDQPARIRNLGPLPFSLSSTGKTPVAGKREASVSPSAEQRQVRKKAKKGEREIIPSSPPVFTSSPSKTAITHQAVSFDFAQDTSPLPKVLPESEQQNDQTSDTPTTQLSSASKPDPKASQQDAGKPRAKTQKKIKLNLNPAAPKVPSSKHRRPMGSNELRDLIGTDVLKGVHANSGSQRMTRHQKQEREATKPGASTKEAVQRRRQSGGGKDAK